MKKIIYILLILVAASASFYGQSKQVWIYNADNYFAKHDFATALEFYQKSLNDSIVLSTEVMPYEITISNQKIDKKKRSIGKDKSIPLTDYIEHQIAMCYHFIADYNHAVEQFKMTSEKPFYPDDIYYYGNALMNVGDYETALSAFEKYDSLETKSDSLYKKSLLDIAGCKKGINKNMINKGAVVRLADSTFNAGTSSFAPMFWESEDRIIFTSARTGGVVFDPYQQESEYLCDLYWTQKTAAGNWETPHNFGRPLNTAQHDASGSFNKYNVIFYTRWSDENRLEQHIYAARMLKFKFFEVYQLDSAINVPGYKSINPYVSEDGGTLYFSSNKPGGYGGMDIWKVTIDKRGNSIGTAENLGPEVNSPYDEVTPFYHEPKTTLFFSSNGKESIGGLDIYKSAFDVETETYGEPVNLGMPINSSKDDAYMIWDSQLKKGYFSSDRKECETNHCYKIYEVKNSAIDITVQGFVYSSETDEPIADARVIFKDVRYEFKPFLVRTDEKGFYKASLSQNMESFMKAKSLGYFADASSVDTRKITQSTILLRDFYLNTISSEEIAIPGIQYDYNKATLRPKSKEILDLVVEYFELNDNLVIELRAHTDNRGNDEYNMKLSEARAQSVVDYLIENNIHKDRLISVGMGETDPIVKDAKTEDEHQKNRRTAFKVVGQDYDPFFEE